MSGRVPATIALPSFERAQQPPANTGNGSAKQQPPAAMPPQQQPQQAFDVEMDLDPMVTASLYPDPTTAYNTYREDAPYEFPADTNDGIDLSALVEANSILPDLPRPPQLFPTTERFMPTRRVLPPEPQYILPDDEQNAYAAPLLQQAEPTQPTYYARCNNCRLLKHWCSGKHPCNRCVAAGISCAYSVRPPTKNQAGTKRQRADSASQDSNPKKARNDAGPTGAVIPQPLHRQRPQSNLAQDGPCDPCRVAELRCDVNHADEIECSRCTKYRNLVDSNHICTARGGEYWQKRFANSRPMYPNGDSDTSCCVRCREKRNSNRPTLCDVDDRVKIGCTPCKIDGILCRMYSDGNGVRPGHVPNEPASLMWNRPELMDGTVARNHRPWWRHMCRACHSNLTERKWRACSWILDVRLGEFKCASCVEKDIPCVDPWTGRVYNAPYQWPGYGDKFVPTGKSISRPKRQQCSNCVNNMVQCRGYDGDAHFACAKCSSWGLTCRIQPDPNKPPLTLPHMDRKMIGWSRNTCDKSTSFIGCKPCRDNGHNCDRNRPCDSCFKTGTPCDPWVDVDVCKRTETIGADSADYYMSLGYGPNGVDSERWDVPENQLVGPNRPKYAEERRLFRPHPLLPKDAVPESPVPPQNPGVGAGRSGNEFFNTFSSPGSSFGDQMSPNGGQQYYGDNNAAARALESGQGFEGWLGNFNAAGDQGHGYNLPPFEGRPQNQDEIQHILGSGHGTSDADLQRLADDIPVDPNLLPMDVDKDVRGDAVTQEEDREQARIGAEIRDAMTAYQRDTRFVGVECRQFVVPELFEVPKGAQVDLPERTLLQLNDQSGPAQDREPFVSWWDPPVYEKHLRQLLSKWKRPGFNVLRDVPDVPLTAGPLYDGSVVRNKPCEEQKSLQEQVCGSTVPSGAFCENLEHMVRPEPYIVCDNCDMASKKNLFDGPQPLTRSEFIRMRSYACDPCVITEASSASFGTLAQMMIQTMFVSEWAVTNFGANMCLFCKRQPSKMSVDDDFLASLVYLCLNCQGVVSENHEIHLEPGVDNWMGGVEPVTLWQQIWEPTAQRLAGWME
ncbi:hypothetical protein EsH8_IX_000456 [Colletotrichum jinshuiense]